MRGLRTIRTSACFLGGSHAVPCTMSPGRFQQDSNLRSRLRRAASYPLDHGSIVREEGIEPSVPRRRGYGPQSTPPAQLAPGVNNGCRTHISGATTRRSATELYPPRCPIDVPTAGPPVCETGALPLSYPGLRAPRRTRTSNDGFVIRHDPRFTMRAWYPLEVPTLRPPARVCPVEVLPPWLRCVRAAPSL